MTSQMAGQGAGRMEAPEVRRYGFPAVLGHEVVAVSCVAREDGNSAEAGHICVIKWRHDAITSERVPSGRLHVWARAGRISFVAKTGEAVNVTLLGEHEYEGLQLGTPWPATHRDSKVANVATGAAHDLKNTITFASAFPRMMRTSAERNAVADSVVGWCQREMPDIHVLRGWPRSADGPVGDQIPALSHKGLLGGHGWLETPPGAGAIDRDVH